MRSGILLDRADHSEPESTRRLGVSSWKNLWGRVEIRTVPARTSIENAQATPKKRLLRRLWEAADLAQVTRRSGLDALRSPGPDRAGSVTDSHQVHRPLHVPAAESIGGGQARGQLQWERPQRVPQALPRMGGVSARARGDKARASLGPRRRASESCEPSHAIEGGGPARSRPGPRAESSPDAQAKPEKAPRRGSCCVFRSKFGVEAWRPTHSAGPLRVIPSPRAQVIEGD